MKKLLFPLFLLLLAGSFAASCSDTGVPSVDKPAVVPPADDKEEDKDDDKDDPTDPTPATAKLTRLTVEGKYLKDVTGKVVNLHGFTQTYQPYFNDNAWNNYDVAACLSYNQRMVDGIVAAGWKMNFVRMHLDPYWSDDASKPFVRYEGHERFSEERFRKYLDEVFIPMAEYFIDKGFYVVMRPPGVCPGEVKNETTGEVIYQGIAVGDSYHLYLKKVWGIVTSHPKIKNNTDYMFELANEPVSIKEYGGNGYAHWTEASWHSCSQFFQEVVDVIRDGGCTENILWVPGLCWQQRYNGYAKDKWPLKGDNIGFAVHCYPGWYGSDSEGETGEGGSEADGSDSDGYTSFKQGWDNNVGCVAKDYPIMVTEIDWAPEKYGKTWGKGITGEAGGRGFGANFKKIADESGNVSWLFFTTCSPDLVNFKDVPGTEGSYTFLNDPEACPWAMYHWFREYAEE